MRPRYGWIIATTVAALTGSGAEGQGMKPHVYGRVYVLSIGIDRYEHRLKVRDTEGCENDARTLGAALKVSYGFAPDYLIGREATRAAILGRLDQYMANLGSRDVLIVFFAGHGQVVDLPDAGRAGFLIPYDADLDPLAPADMAAWKREALDMRDLTDRTEGGDAKHVLFLVDACCSGFMTRRSNLEERMDLRKLLGEPSRIVVAATTEREEAFAKRGDRGQHGIFTSALLDVLKTEDAMSVTDVFVEVRKRVIADDRSGQRMTPQMGHYGKGGGEFVFMPLAIPEDEVRATVEAAQGPFNPGRTHALSRVLQRTQERLSVRSTLEDIIEAFQANDYRYTAEPAAKQQLWERRFKRFEENAAIGDAKAMVGLHYCYAKGLGVDKKDESLAYRWAKAAFESGYAGGRHVLGRCWYYQIGAPKNPVAALKLMGEAADGGFPISLIQVGMTSVEKGDVAGARRAWQQASDAGVLEARVYLAYFHLGFVPGIVLKNSKVEPARAIEELLPAARKELPDAQLLLAKVYAVFLENPDKPTATAWLERAAQNGQAQAQGILARELAGEDLWMVSDDKPLNLGLAPDPRAARRWAEMAAAQDDSNALLVMAQSLVKEGDFNRALEACKKAAALNHPCAFLLESKWYGNGDTVHPKNSTKAFQLGKRAADMGNASGQVWIGALYADHAVPKDQFVQTKQGATSMHHALHYWTLAAEQGDETAHRMIKDVADMIRANPEAGYWDQFQRAYSEDVAKFRYHCGGQLNVKEPDEGEAPPNGGSVFGVFVMNYNGPGVLVSKVVPKSPAKGIGLEVGDAILQINGQTLETADDFVRAIRAAGITVKVVIRNVRDGSHFEKDVRLNK